MVDKFEKGILYLSSDYTSVLEYSHSHGNNSYFIGKTKNSFGVDTDGFIAFTTSIIKPSFTELYEYLIKINNK